MDLFYNREKISQLKISPSHTVGQLKQTLKDWLVPQGITRYNIRIIFKDGTELSPIVLTTDQYDNVNFEAQSSNLSGGKIYIITDISQQETTQKEHFEFQQLFPNLRWEIIMKMSDPELINLCMSSNEMENFCNTRYWFWKNRISEKLDRDPTDQEIQRMYRNEGNWFKVYLTLKKRGKRSKLHIPPENIADSWEIDWEDDDVYEFIKDKLRSWLRDSKLPLKTGDTVALHENRDRNNNLFFIFINDNGSIGLEEPSGTVDDYGNVPEFFRFPDYPIKYFEDVIDHNTVMWLDERFEPEIRRNVKLGIPPINFVTPPRRPIIYSWFTYNNNKYWVLGIGNSDPNSEMSMRNFLKFHKGHNFSNDWSSYEPENEENIIYKSIDW